MLSDTSIIITAGFRAGYLSELLYGIGRWMPEAEVIVVNDDGYYQIGNHIKDLPSLIWEEVPKGTFLTRKRNLGVQLASRKYVTLMADDFEVDSDVRRAMIRMVDILDAYRTPDVVCGTFNSRSYEGSLEVKPGQYIKEHRLNWVTDFPLAMSDKINLWKVDIAVNWFTARRKAMLDVPWDESIGPIGGEHADWFLDMKAAGKTVIWTPGLNINEQPKDATKEDPAYGGMRKRVWDGHKLMLAKRGVKVYYGFDDEVKK
jgi:hypothetical protein